MKNFVNKRLQNFKKHGNVYALHHLNVPLLGSHDLDSEKAEDDLIVAGLAKVYNNAAQKSIGFISKKTLRTSALPLRTFAFKILKK